MSAGTEHARLGETFWAAVGFPDNVSSKPLTITDVTLLDAPDGLRVLGYAAFSVDDTDGFVPLARGRHETGMPDFDSLPDHAKAPLVVQPHSDAVIFYMAKVQITAPPKGIWGATRFDYIQNDRHYQQTLHCEFELKVER
ncbi:hypothetical protein G6045_20065 [Streptomyces sp. YC504]|uniref:Uncharacterized protein n=1 Tax=Streptomyces mesophilus TaxID=1775132 RepID=A0A6G4XKJ3_9ACTN|nr:hypothetical protein [Streptomyces mesophilus]NGO77938.1 hypothetical protein [Streptomyces mesophilus]